MAWQDRPYYSGSSGQTGNPFMWLLTGSVPLFTVFGIRVRAHASLLIFILLGIFIGLPGTTGFRDNIASMAALFVLVLLHEFGHCFTARWVGGEADEILMHPLGGLAMAHPPRRPLPTFLTIVGGPAVNFVICVVCGLIMWQVAGWLPWQGRWHPWEHSPWLIQLSAYSWWIYYISLGLLLFNLLPIFPLDGGQMLQTVLWPWFGWYKSMSISCVVGMIGAVLGAVWSIYWHSTLLFFVGCGALSIAGAIGGSSLPWGQKSSPTRPTTAPPMSRRPCANRLAAGGRNCARKRAPEGSP